MKKAIKKPPKKNEAAELKRDMARLKREANAKIKGLESQVKSQMEELEKKEEEIRVLKVDLQRKEQMVEWVRWHPRP